MSAGRVPTTGATRLNVSVKGVYRLTGCFVLGFVAAWRTSAGSRMVTMHLGRSPGAISGGSIIVKASDLMGRMRRSESVSAGSALFVDSGEGVI